MPSKDRELPAEWQLLRADGWINVTGLPVTTVACNGSMYVILPNVEKTAGSGSNNGMAVLYLNDGTVWLRRGYSNMLVRFPCEEDGMFVPCSNGEMISAIHLLSRISDPFWSGGEAKDYTDLQRPVCLGYNEFPATWEEIQRHPAFQAEKNLRRQKQQRVP